MQRRSDKHGSRLDEALGRETNSVVQGQPVEARAEEEREQEGPGEGEPTPDSRLVGGRAGDDSGGMGDDEVEARAELARHVDPSTYPARPEELRESARRNHAPAWIVDALAALPDQTYGNTEEVWLALGGSRERRP